jgi:site-specific DNA-cytosine methylase
MTPLRSLSLFSGVGMFDIAAVKAGFEIAHFCEIDRSCWPILNRHFPGVPLHDDITTFDVSLVGPVDVVTFGSPCQNLSVAGKRAGLAGKQSGLFYEAIRVIADLRRRDGRPRFALWENVVGALSSHHGRDFAAVLDAFLDLGARDVCWRVLDSQWHGSAQRRRRVFLVADFGGECADNVLSLTESLSWHPPTRPKARQGTPQSLAECFGVDSEFNADTDLIVPIRSHESGGAENTVAYALTANNRQDRPESGAATKVAAPYVPDVAYACSTKNNHDNPENYGATKVAPVFKRRGGFGWSEHDDLSATLEAEGGTHQGGPEHIPIVCASIQASGAVPARTGNERTEAQLLVTVPIAVRTDNTSCNGKGVLCDGTSHSMGGSTDAVAVPIGFIWQRAGGPLPMENLAPTLRVGAEGSAVCHENLSGSVTASDHAKALRSGSRHSYQFVQQPMALRRLTPTECERLFLLPDGYTEGASDSVRYRQLGNGLVWTCAFPILQAIHEELSHDTH